MSVTFTIIDDSNSSNGADGRKHIFGTLSFTNPYTASGESLTVSNYFPHEFLGGKVTAVSGAVTAALAGLAHTGTFRGDNNTIAGAAIFQMFQTGLSGTASAGLWVDNTTANISGLTCMVEMWGN